MIITAMMASASSVFRIIGALALAVASPRVGSAQASDGQAATVSLSALSDSFRDLSRRVHPSVVKVVATGYRASDDEQPPEEPGVLTRQQSSGSGVIIRAGGLIVTNAHVVMGAQNIRVTLTLPRDTQTERHSTLRPAGRTMRAEVVGFDVETDLALLRVPEKGLPALTLADSDQVEQGQIVLAFGSPLGLDNSVSLGVISSTARQLKPDDPMIYIQTDAPINPGSSGGPLVDAEGRVVGINTLILSQSGGNEGIGFAVPSNIVTNIVEQLVRTGRVVRGEIGVTVQTVTAPLATAWKLPQDWGVVIADVEAGSAAEKAGLRAGDVVLALDSKPMENARQFNVNVYHPGIGSTVRIDVLREKQKLTISVPVTERKQEPDRVAALAGREENLVAELGIFILDLNERLREQFGPLRKEEGVLVASRTSDGPLFDDGLKPGDVIYGINRQSVKTVSQFRKVLRELKSGDAIALQVERQGHLRFLAFELP
jgi:serine protease Do